MLSLSPQFLVLVPVAVLLHYLPQSQCAHLGPALLCFVVCDHNEESRFRAFLSHLLTTCYSVWL
jgi:hypothetical protein